MACRNCDHGIVTIAGISCKKQNNKLMDEDDTCSMDTSSSHQQSEGPTDPMTNGRFCPVYTTRYRDRDDGIDKLDVFPCQGERCGKYNLCNNIKGV